MSAETSTSLDLATRAGLPPAIAYLRDTHPNAGWRAHANYGELADFWLGVHAALRGEGAQVTATADAFRDRRTDADAFQRALVPRLNRFLGHLDQHHRIEDHAYFPKFRALDARMVAGFDLLEADHHAIHAGIDATVASARALLAAIADSSDTARAADGFATISASLVRLLHRHLADEEEIVIPALLEHGERPFR